ncbi:alpha/beta hydrolase [Xenophilus arseniciresistens]|uniref:Alpha/beta hydrolase n=1 Tax=Xenophilus arseniciresistens TaxID=1283306 RepID=A0AAE3N5J7_9BURK|nr:alpha/beta hydrolase [Xenophilus arseniciresistens]MDA7416295.1 alpha/beta hydrolase [Xenophilus arseniciresistens]
MNAFQKPTLLLLPGLLCDHAVWREQQAALADEVDSLVIDYGQADSIEAMARLALSQVRSPVFSVAGHSMGGRVALEIARLAPQRLQRIALMDTGMDPIAEGAAGEREIQGRMSLLNTARESGMRAMGQAWARGMVHGERLDTPLFEEILAMIERKTPDIFAAQLKALIARPDARGVLADLQCPTLLLCGREDAWSPLARHEDMHARVPGSTLVVVEHSGHMSTMEQPAAVTQALRDWLAQPARLA